MGGRGGFRWLGGGEVGAADPDHGEVDDQGEQRDPGGDQEPAAEPGGEGMVVDRCGQRAARVRPVPGLRGFLHKVAPKYQIKKMLDYVPANTPAN